MTHTPAISVIIPVLNEQEALPKVLTHLKATLKMADEILVVDGGSEDKTVEIANEFGVTVLVADKKGRAAQMDFGARKAINDYLCFLHADTITPNDLSEIIHKVLLNKKIALAGFVSVMRGKKLRWIITFLNYTKTFLAPLIYQPYSCLFKGLRLLFGDQVMFCRRSDYLISGGFNPQTLIMEEAELCLSMNKLGSIRQIHRRVYSSDPGSRSILECPIKYFGAPMVLSSSPLSLKDKSSSGICQSYLIRTTSPLRRP